MEKGEEQLCLLQPPHPAMDLAVRTGAVEGEDAPVVESEGEGAQQRLRHRAVHGQHPQVGRRQRGAPGARQTCRSQNPSW